MSMEYKPRFVRPDQMAELSNLWHLSRVATSGGDNSRYARMLWASKEFAKVHPEVTSTGAYKDLDGMLN